MQPTSAGQNVILTGYISYSGPGPALGTLTEDTAARVPGLAERFSGICNSVADFFMSAKGKVNNSLHQLGDRIKKYLFLLRKNGNTSGNAAPACADSVVFSDFT